jgi:phosphoserine phosphatase RsbU/P
MTPPGHPPAICASSIHCVADSGQFPPQIEAALASQPDMDVSRCPDPAAAIALAVSRGPTVILQFFQRADAAAMETLRQYRSHPLTIDVPLMIIAEGADTAIKAEAFLNGASDFLDQMPGDAELLARVRYHSQAYINLLERNMAHAALLSSQRTLQGELEEAERYVRSLLPPPANDDEFSTDWVFISSRSLGGDALGYHWVDDDHFAIYLLDVCGHGVGAALLSVSVLNVLRGETLGDVDVRQPDAVLAALNETFAMERHHTMFFTLWYGVWNRHNRILCYASGGHPPAILFANGSTAELRTPGLVVGGMRNTPYTCSAIRVPGGASLYLFSDGVYEFPLQSPAGTMHGLGKWLDALARPVRSGSKVADMLDYARSAQGRFAFPDDFSLLEVRFAPEDEPPPVLNIQLALDLAELPRLAAAVSSFFIETKLDATQSQTFQLCLEEVVSNIITHAFNRPAADARIHLRIVLEWFEVVAQVVDTGRPFNPLADAAPPDLSSPLENRPVGGLGVLFLKHFMDRLLYERIGNQNRLVLAKRYVPVATQFH